MNSRQNIVLIMTDQHGARWTGCYGHPFIRTPAIDSLAAEGVRFDNAYCNSPLCVPSRMSFLTGRRVQDIEIWDNNTYLPPGSMTWPRALASAGFDVILDGKMHIAGPDRLQGFKSQLSRDVDDPMSMPVPDWRSGTVPGISFRMFEVGFRREDAGYRDVDDDVADAAVEFLNARAVAPQERPFALVVGFHGPHPKWYVEDEYLDLYPEDSLPDPDFPRELLARQNPVCLRNRAMRGSRAEGDPVEDVRRARRHFFAKVTRVDRRIGQVLDALRTTGLIEQSLVVYTSDHGEMAGEHGLWNKHCFYEESAAIPLIVRTPNDWSTGMKEWSAGSARSEIVSLLDLSAALTPDRGDRQDLITLLNGGAEQWDNCTLSEYYGTWIDRPTAMLRRDRFKLIYSPGDPPELYDVESDPRELDDLAPNQAYSDVLGRLRDELLRHWDPEDLYRRVVASQDARRHLWPPQTRANPPGSRGIR